MNRKIQFFRTAIQLMFLLLAIIGLYFGVRKYFFYVLILSFVMGNFFCGWICPYGTVQEFLARLGDKLIKKKFTVSPSIQKYLQFSKYFIYLLMTFETVKLALFPFDGYKAFMMSLNNFSKIGFNLAFFIMITYLIISIFFERFFCIYFCPESIKFALRSLTRVFTIKRNKDSCINCKLCNKSCPMNINVAETKPLRTPQCINCFKCIGSCPVGETLSYGSVFDDKFFEAVINKFRKK